MKERLQNVNWREILVNVMGFFIARVSIFSMNPIGIGYFIAAYGEKRNRIFLFISVLLGMATATSSLGLAKYVMIMLVFGIVVGILEKLYDRVGTGVLSAIGAIVTIIFSLFDIGTILGDQSSYALAVLEGMLVLASANLFYIGIGSIFRSKKKTALENEEIISIAILLGAIVYSMPNIAQGQFSIIETAAYLVILFFGYRYGGGAGTIAGVVCGLVISLETGNPILVGVFAILGLVAGMFRELGRIPMAMIFLIMTIGFGFFYEITLIQVAGARGLVSALTIFLLCPRRWIRRMNTKVLVQQRDSYAKDNLKTMAKFKLSEFSDAFSNLSKTLYQMSETRSDLCQDDINLIFDSLADRLCSRCVHCNRCFHHNTYDKNRTSFSVLNAVKQRGMVLAGDLPQDFQDSCLKFNTFLEETNKEISIANLNLNWNNRMAESREAIARQLGEVSTIMKDFAEDLLDMEEGNEEEERLLEKELTMYQLDIRKIAIMEKRNKQKEVFLDMRTKRGGCITTREVASIVGNVLGIRMRPSFETKNIVSKEYDRVILTEDTNYKVLTGIAKQNKDGERVSGDNFSFLQLEGGEMVMTLSDGMGAGEEACEQSQSLVDLLEQCMEAGFSEESAIRLINSTMVVKPNHEVFSTLDMSIINLYNGKCNFLKMGASTTFIKRKKWVETIHSASLPVGIFHQMDLDSVSKRLYDEDFIIMVSDGILDALLTEQPEEYLKNLLLELDSHNPQEIADYILDRVSDSCASYVGDDRTVLVAGFWEK